MKTTAKLTGKFIKPKHKSYEKKELKKGIKVEREHSPTKKIQENISKNHLDEDKNYYKKLAKMERKHKRK
jgi:hypothetical protein